MAAFKWPLRLAGGWLLWSGAFIWTAWPYTFGHATLPLESSYVIGSIMSLSYWLWVFLFWGIFQGVSALWDVQKRSKL